MRMLDGEATVGCTRSDGTALRKQRTGVPGRLDRRL